MRKMLALIAALMLVTGGATRLVADSDHDKIEKVMKTAMSKNGLCKKVIDGQATDAQKKALLEQFQGLSKATPPKGDASSWKSKTGALVDAAQAAVDGKPDATDLLKNATNCTACHQVHRTR